MSVLAEAVTCVELASPFVSVSSVAYVAQKQRHRRRPRPTVDEKPRPLPVPKPEPEPAPAREPGYVPGSLPIYIPRHEVNDTFWLDVVGIPIDLWMQAFPHGMPWKPDIFASLVHRRDVCGDFRTPVDLVKRYNKPLPSSVVSQRVQQELVTSMGIPGPMLGGTNSTVFVGRLPGATSESSSLPACVNCLTSATVSLFRGASAHVQVWYACRGCNSIWHADEPQLADYTHSQIKQMQQNLTEVQRERDATRAKLVEMRAKITKMQSQVEPKVVVSSEWTYCSNCGATYQSDQWHTCRNQSPRKRNPEWTWK